MTHGGIWPENWGLLYAAFAFSQAIGLITYWTLLALTGLFCWLFTVSDGNQLQFSAGLVIWATIYIMAFALLNAVAAMVDRSGRHNITLMEYKHVLNLHTSPR
ncbi:MAG: hypothetical protein IIA11_04245 [Proteobacteria bacterium]|nr:hypothetical protein [Pseudomonadota bacterium]